MPIIAEKRISTVNKWIRSRVAFHLSVFGFYLLTVALVLNNLVLRISSVVSSGPLNDYHLFHWNNWWLRYALFRVHFNFVQRRSKLKQKGTGR
jgi:hypothetical protein